jgi:hypothetical protein
MSKFALITVTLLVAASAAVTVAIQRRSEKQQLAQTESLKQQADQIAQAAAENERLSHLVARAGTTQSLSAEQLRDLMRLRNEVGQLRNLEGQKAQLEATNTRLRDLAAKSQEALAHARSLPNYWPKEQLAFSGLSDPPSAVRSMLAAMKSGDLNALMDCFDPSIVTNFEAELKREGADPAVREAEIKTTLTDFVAHAEGFHIVDQTVTAPDEVTINLSLDGDGEGKILKMRMRRTGNEWKFFEGL